MIIDVKPKDLGLPTEAYISVEEVHDVSMEHVSFPRKRVSIQRWLLGWPRFLQDAHPGRVVALYTGVLHTQVRACQLQPNLLKAQVKSQSQCNFVTKPFLPNAPGRKAVRFCLT